MTPIVGFAPDADPTTPGVLVDCVNLVPFESGFKGAPAPAAVGVAALAAACRGAVVTTRLDGTRRVFAGTQTRLYQLAGAAWTDRSKSGGYVGSTESRWSFCQFGDTTVASNLADPMQQAGAAGFDDVPTAPRALIVVSASNNFVLAFNTSDPEFGVSSDRWWNCAQYDQTNWVLAQGGPTTGRLVAVEGPIVAAMALGDYVAAYKAKGIFLGAFAGGNEQWVWTLMRGDGAGAVGQDAVCDIGGVHFIVGMDDFWLFDGTQPIPVGEGITRRWFNETVDPTYRYRTQASYDRQNSLVRIGFPSKGSGGVIDRCLVFHTKLKRWGIADNVVQAPLTYISPGVTIDGMDAIAATIDALPNVPLDSQFWVGDGQMAAFFDGSNRLVALNGVAAPSSFTTGDLGDDDTVTMIDRFRVRFTKRPATASATGMFKMNEGDALVIGATNAINDGKFDIRQSGRFHRLRVDMTGDHQETQLDVKPIAVGGR